MIKNIVFDLGNVLVEFKPEQYIKKLGFDEKKSYTLKNLIFESKHWNDFDRGIISFSDYINILKKENPTYSSDFKIVFKQNWESDLLIPKEESIQYLKYLSKNYNIYILSNISEHILMHLMHFDFFDYVKNGTFSYSVKSCKPEKEIYQIFFFRNNLIPEECLFIDDKEKNILAAEKLGMNGIVFKDNISDIEKKLKLLNK